MKNSTILRTAKVGGFNKEDVLTYVDELNAKIDSLKTELEQAQAAAANPAELEEYKSEIVRLTQLVNDNENAISEVRTAADAEKSELRTQMEGKITELSEENNNLKDAVASLEYKLEEAKNNVQTVPAEAAPVDTSAYENEISELKLQLENARNQITEMSGEMTKLSEDISEKGKTIQRLTLENDELRLQTDENGFSKNFDMGALFSEAQATAKKIVVEARIAADKLVRDAEYESEKILSEANTKANQITADAENKAENMEADARKDAKFAIDAAENLKVLFNEQAKKFVLQVDKLIDSLDDAKAEISGEVNDFIDGKTGLDKAVEDAKSVVNETEYSAPVYEEPAFYNEPVTEAVQEEVVEENDGYSDIPYMSSISNYESDEEVAETMADDLLENYQSEPKSYDENELNDILSSFAIDPVSSNDEEDDEPVPPVKGSPALGFDLDDLAKLAEEAEKDM